MRNVISTCSYTPPSLIYDLSKDPTVLLVDSENRGNAAGFFYYVVYKLRPEWFQFEGRHFEFRTFGKVIV
jgi:hypothetical protein